MTPSRRTPTRRLLVTGAGALLAASAYPALALPAEAAPSAGDGAVFVQLNGIAGNEIAAYARDGAGRLTPVGDYATGGDGGTAAGAPVDALASQNSLTTAQNGSVLLAVNAGSDTVTSFAVEGTRLERRSVVASGGQFPVSVAVHDDLVYVLNSGGAGTVSGFRLDNGVLRPLPGSTRSLGLANTTPPAFLTAPAEASFSPDGHVLVVTTKANGTLLSFTTGEGGLLSATPTSTASSGPVPFSFVWDARGDLHVTQAGDSTLAAYRVGRDGTLTANGVSAADGGAALCWSARIGDTIVGANAGSGTLSAWHVNADGTNTLTSPIAATTGAGPIDLAVPRDGRDLYVQESGAGAIGVFQVRDGGQLQSLQTVTGLPAFTTTGMEGIAAV